MKPIQKDELYENLGRFLKAKGIELQEGSYSRRIQRGCNLLADAINLSQKGLGKAKAEIDKGLDRMRQVIHEKTAPKPPPTAAKPFAAGAAAAQTQPPAATTRKRPRSRSVTRRPSARTGAKAKRG